MLRFPTGLDYQTNIFLCFFIFWTGKAGNAKYLMAVFRFFYWLMSHKFIFLMILYPGKLLQESSNSVSLLHFAIFFICKSMSHVISLKKVKKWEKDLHKKRNFTKKITELKKFYFFTFTSLSHKVCVSKMHWER